MSRAMTLTPRPFKICFSTEQVAQLTSDVAACRMPKATFESLQSQKNYGIGHDWTSKALQYWKNGFDWRKQEERLNSVQNFMVTIEDQGHPVELHYIAHFCSDADAIPLLLLHGWPGSSVEFVDTVKILAASTSPSFHVIVPNALGFALSQDPPLDREFGLYDVARHMATLMAGLGFDEYAVQGGDLGSVVARIMASRYPSAVKAVNLNYLPLLPPNDRSDEVDAPLSEREERNAQKAVEFVATGRGYGIMHGTRPSTIGLVIQSNPLALLAWLGEKFRDWTDEPLSLDLVLETCSLWWMQETFPKAIYAYREVANGVGRWHQDPALYIAQPFGYSSFGHEIASAPAAWARKTGNLQYYSYREQGGHFAALERPALFAEEMKLCFGQIFKRSQS